ncbi:MAG: polysaccharide pyruvyl transferase family protein [Deltaproteobacteria bacterium]|nr:polysaccharide pyruvyl transferase family protein [Deltaproteobacteria bacterium]
MKGEALGRLGRKLLLGAWKKGREVVTDALDADRMLQRSMAALVEAAAARYPIDAGHEWRPGHPLELLLVGYAGTRNTGADVRVEEMIRQFRHLFGDEHLALSVTTLDPARTRGYFNGVRQLEVPSIFPKFLADAVHVHHGVVACEGSMFKSKFASALTTFMAGAIGLARAEQKLAIGYGGEAGAMDPELEKFVRKVCGGSLVIARNAASVDVLGKLGIPARLGTDTAWTFEPERKDLGREILMARGWDGERRVLVVCPINPFWWPVKPDLGKGLEHAITRAHTADHYQSVYFHKGGPDVAKAQARYLDALAGPIRRAVDKYGCFVALVGMEALDRKACEALAERLGALPTGRPAIVVSDEHPLQSMVSVLWQASAMVSSRYHAIVTSMGGGVPSLGVTMDERIRNLMTEREHEDLLLEVDQPDLESALDAPLARLFEDPEPVRAAMRRTVARNLRVMGTMGMTMIEAVRARHPAFPIREGLGEVPDADPMAHLPRLGAAVSAIAREA